MIIAEVILYAIGLRFLYTLFALATIVPSIAVAVRRLHDIDKIGWLVLIGLIPFVGWLVIIYWAVQPGTSGPNQYGHDPLAGAEAPAGN